MTAMTWNLLPLPTKKRGRGDEPDLQRHEDDLQMQMVRCRVSCGGAAPRRAKRTMDDEPTLTEAFKRTRISCAPGELRLKNDIATLHQGELVRRGYVGAIQVGPNALILSVTDHRYLVAVAQKYPFEPPSVRRLQAGDEDVDLAILQNWSAVYTLEDLATALFEKAQIERAIKFEMAQPPAPPLHCFFIAATAQLTDHLEPSDSEAMSL